jgi:low temperature requirement protein LtrA
MARPAVLPPPARPEAHTFETPDRKVTWLELFFDLVFVAAIAQVGSPLAADLTPTGLGRFAFLFVLIFWAWHGHTTYCTRFAHDDAAHRLLTLVQMFAAAVMAVNAREPLDSRDAAGFAAAYAVIRLILLVQYLRVGEFEHGRGLVRATRTGLAIAAALWLASALTPVPWRFGLWALAFGVDVATPLLAGRRALGVPPHAHHLPERFGLFTIILLGDAMVGVMRGMESQSSWPAAAFLSAVGGMALVFVTWWLYFDVARGAEELRVRTPRDLRDLHAWTYAHVPLYLGIAVTGVGLHHLITVAGRSALHASEALVLGTALGLTLASIGLIVRARRRWTPSTSLR